MLTELLAHRVEKKSDRKTKASISKAVEIVDQIDDDALCGLTVVYAINSWATVAGHILSRLTHHERSIFSSVLPRPPNWF